MRKLILSVQIAFLLVGLAAAAVAYELSAALAIALATASCVGLVGASALLMQRPRGYWSLQAVWLAFALLNLYGAAAGLILINTSEASRDSTALTPLFLLIVLASVLLYLNFKFARSSQPQKTEINS